MKDKKHKDLEEKKLPIAMQEFEEAFQEFFNKKPKPKNEEEEKKQSEDFVYWYNNVRKQSDTEKTPAEMFNENREMKFVWDEDYKEPDEMFYEADQFFLKGKYKEALALADEILEILPDDEEALLLKAEILPAIDKKKEAEEILDKIFKKYGKSSSWHFNRAGLYFWHGNLPKALESIKEGFVCLRKL